MEAAEARLAEITRQIDARFERVFESNKARESELNCPWQGQFDGPERHKMAPVKERVYVHKTYAAGLALCEGSAITGLLKATPKAAVDEFERNFLPDVAQHSGEIMWRVKPYLKHVQGLVTGEGGYYVRCRCSFMDSPDEVIDLTENAA